MIGIFHTIDIFLFSMYRRTISQLFPFNKLIILIAPSFIPFQAGASNPLPPPLLPRLPWPATVIILTCTVIPPSLPPTRILHCSLLSTRPISTRPRQRPSIPAFPSARVERWDYPATPITTSTAAAPAAPRYFKRGDMAILRLWTCWVLLIRIWSRTSKRKVRRSKWSWEIPWFYRVVWRTWVSARLESPFLKVVLIFPQRKSWIFNQLSGNTKL